MILTLGFGEIVRVFFLNFEPTGGASGLAASHRSTALWQCLCAVAIFYRLAAAPDRHARFGRA